jgi:hypothetical protein
MRAVSGREDENKLSLASLRIDADQPAERRGGG